MAQGPLDKKTKYTNIVLACCFVLFGACNTISIKYQDTQEVPPGPGLEPVEYLHPTLQ
ncbi:hypothetical protein KIPB_010695, partial [Kipferlia bialata]|eukprot:g10695.t1